MKTNHADEANQEDERLGDQQAPPSGSAGGDAEDVEGALALAKARAEEYYRNWQRSAADFINYKRRVEQERAETARLASAALVINLLPIGDDLERAVTNVDAHLAGLNWVQGVVAIQRKFAQLMEAMGVSEVQAEGQPFDPVQHEAVGKAPGDDGQILHVVQKGYRLGDRVVRPAMVIVGSGETPSTKQSERDDT